MMGNCIRDLGNLSTSEADVVIYGGVKDYQGVWLGFGKDWNYSMVYLRARQGLQL